MLQMNITTSRIKAASIHTIRVSESIAPARWTHTDDAEYAIWMPSRLRFSFRDAITANNHIWVALDALTCLSGKQAVLIFGHFSRDNVAERCFSGAPHFNSSRSRKTTDLSPIFETMRRCAGSIALHPAMNVQQLAQLLPPEAGRRPDVPATEIRPVRP